MDDGSAAIEYAREVYAACATVGYTSPDVTRLKVMLDARSAEDLDAIVALAQAVQRASMAWAGRPAPR